MELNSEESDHTYHKTRTAQQRGSLDSDESSLTAIPKGPGSKPPLSTIKSAVTFHSDTKNESIDEKKGSGTLSLDTASLSPQSSCGRRTPSSSLPRRKRSARSTYITREVSVDSLEKNLLAWILNHWLTQCTSAILVLFTVVLICLDTSDRARGHRVPNWQVVAMALCFVAYVLECGATIWTHGKKSFQDIWTYIDSMVIMTSLVDYVITILNLAQGFEVLRLFRVLRLLRLGKLMRSLHSLQRKGWLKEQYILMMMMTSCLKTLAWAFIICFFVMTLWSILAVELLNDLVREIADNSPSTWAGCSRCSRSFGSIMESNWTFFQTIVAGDSWGLVALPVIEQHPWTALIFVGALASLIFGVLNMINAVVVGAFAEQRAKDISAVANDLEFEEVQEKKALERMFSAIDVDHSGSLSMEELRHGALKVREFRHYLRVLDIDENDLVELFDMIDADRSGEVDPDEFIEELYRMKHTDPKTATRFVKHLTRNLVCEMIDKQRSLDERLDEIQENVMEKMTSVEARLISDLERTSSREVQEVLEKHVNNIDDAVSKSIEKIAEVALDAGRDRAISKASKAIKQVIRRTSEHASELNIKMKQLCTDVDINSGSEPTFYRQTSPSLQGIASLACSRDPAHRMAHLQNPPARHRESSDGSTYDSSRTGSVRTAGSVISLGEPISAIAPPLVCLPDAVGKASGRSLPDDVGKASGRSLPDDDSMASVSTNDNACRVTNRLSTASSANASVDMRENMWLAGPSMPLVAASLKPCHANSNSFERLAEKS